MTPPATHPRRSPRTSALLHPQRQPAPVRPAATVLLLRDAPTPDGSSRLEVLMTRRAMTASFAPGVYVFPGGGIDAADAHAPSSRRATQSDAQLTASVAAIRECFEELGVVLTEAAFLPENQHLASDFKHFDATENVANPVATPLGYDRDQPFLPQVVARGDRLAGANLFTLVHWVTDRDLPRRFDVPFLVARMPPNQTPVPDEAEQFEPIWVAPGEALARFDRGEFAIIFPTIRTLKALTAHASVQTVLDACAHEQPWWVSCPRAGLLNGQDSRHMAHEQPFGELELVSPDGQIVHELAWQSQQPVPLLRHLSRLTAPNTSAMTGPGTNTYLVGTADTGFIVIDPGPAIASHVERIMEATGGHIVGIVCTHSHPDHAPAAKPLADAVAAQSFGRPPIMGLRSAPTARPGSEFSPDIDWTELLQKSEQQSQWICWQSAKSSVNLPPEAASACLWSEATGPISLRLIHTPGHATNHLCLLMQEDALLFSGDHVLNGSTTVIDPPDGHMGDYLQSLDILIALCQTEGVAHILPAHGHVLGSAELAPAQIIERLKAHRLDREAKVLAAALDLPQGTPAQWVAHAYADTDPRLWPVAERSLLAHLAHLREAGKLSA